MYQGDLDTCIGDQAMLETALKKEISETHSEKLMAVSVSECQNHLNGHLVFESETRIGYRAKQAALADEVWERLRIAKEKEAVFLPLAAIVLMEKRAAEQKVIHERITARIISPPMQYTIRQQTRQQI